MKEIKVARSSVLTKEILNTGSYVRIPTKGRSMFPLISGTICIEPAAAEDIRVGDIIVYSYEKNLVAHRLTKKINKEGEEILVVKGDNWLGSSEVVPENVIGKVIKVEKWGIQLNLTKGMGKTIDSVFRCISPLTARLYSLLKNGKQWFARKNEKPI